MKINKKLSLFLAGSIVFIIGCGGGGGGSSQSSGGSEESGTTQSAGGNVALGPIANANVDIFSLSGNKLYSTQTAGLSDSDEVNGSLVSFDMEKVGKFQISNSNNLNDDDLFLVKVYGGEDIDADDDGKVDINPTPLKGTLYAYVYGKDLKDDNVTVNEFTTLAALYIQKSGIQDKDRIEAVLSNLRKLLFNDVNTTLYHFNPAKLQNGQIADLNKLKNPNVFDSILNSSTFENYIDNNASLFIDADKDGLFDDFENMIGTNPNNADSDGDGVSDYGELIAGTNPEISDISENEDILYQYQWHLKNTGQKAGAEYGGIAGYDINVTKIWSFDTGLKSIKIGVVDTGIELNHPDLNTQIDEAESYRYSDGSQDPTPDSDQLINEPYDSAHGTAVSGIIAAKSWNKIGVAGISPSSTLVGLNVFSYPYESSFLNALSKDVNISSNSWGVSSGVIWEDSSLDDVISDKSNEGTIFVFAAGNDRYDYNDTVDENGTKYYFGNANNSCALNNKYTIVVAAMDANGTYASYSNFGDDVLISAPAGEFGYYYPATVTTDLTGLDYGFDSTGFADDYRGGKRFDVEGNEDGNYTNYMNGTSAATPMVSGVVSLMLAVNPNLTYRDVKYILAKTARKIDVDNPDWSQNAAGIWFNPNYGFGLVDAGAAVEMAKNFISLPPEKDTQLYSKDVNISIPDNNTTGVSVSINVDENISIEYVNAWVSIPDHPFPGDLEIDLISPSGTVSKLSYGGKYYVDGTIDDKRYGSNKFLDEYSEGEWKLVVKDLNPGNTGTLTNFSLKIYGH